MADLADVESALLAIATAALYPAGVSGSEAVSPVAGVACHLSRGWPDPERLNPWLKAGRVWVTVYPVGGQGRITTRYPRIWRPGVPVAPTLTVAVAGPVVTFGGTGGAGQVAGVAVGDGIAPAAWAYRLGAADTPDTVTVAFAAAIPGATAAGPVLTLATTEAVQARVVADVPATMELRRQEQVFRIVVWSPTPALRDTVAGAIDAAVSEVRTLVMPDGTATGAPEARAGYTTDEAEVVRLYRRDLVWVVEYQTVARQTQPTVLFPFFTVSVDPDTLVDADGAVLTGEDGADLMIPTTVVTVGYTPQN